MTARTREEFLQVKDWAQKLSVQAVDSAASLEAEMTRTLRASNLTVAELRRMVERNPELPPTYVLRMLQSGVLMGLKLNTEPLVRIYPETIRRCAALTVRWVR
jgi:hypothetical protein